MIKSQFLRSVVVGGALVLYATTAYSDGVYSDGAGNNGYRGPQAGVGNDAGHTHPPPFEQTMPSIDAGGGESLNVQTNNQENSGPEFPSQSEDGGNSEQDAGSSGD
jgi:hypothetical protein